ncbi:4-hydroxy-tetrahydrodipicolinate synthase [Qipengyuania qiaonensis]|uniref:4-hydroxy-tetrahydrodipicolinate synthase n=1 Tax=Qipengyuania qiaonensis TaxID=2867240 RepID=A0ABS7J833_9SPHN|nr:4-hydroxy-tetrahydrodipicolinate synthase [Qipengyuania qiaonensis]
MFKGSIPALITPFDIDGRFNATAYAAHIDRLIDAGSSALVACGTTGEAATLSFEEHFEVVAACVKAARARVPVIAGTGSNDTRIAVRNLEAAEKAGADAALIVAPYYNRPNSDGLLQHFSLLAEASELPILLYNVPGRTVADLTPDLVIELARRYPEKIVGLKDSSGDLGRVELHRKEIGQEFALITGNDDQALKFARLGGCGCISVTANVAPHLCAEFQTAVASGDWDKAEAIDKRLQPLHAAMFSDASPGPAKFAIASLVPDFPHGLRLPMTWPGVQSRACVTAALQTAGLQ